MKKRREAQCFAGIGDHAGNDEKPRLVVEFQSCGLK